MIFGIDFDGTCCYHTPKWDSIGREIPHSARVLKRLAEAKHKLILFTMRDGQGLEAAQKWFAQHNLPLFGVQTNPTQKEWTSSPKAHCDYYIDDRALGIPLIGNNVDWIKVEALLEEIGELPQEKKERIQGAAIWLKNAPTPGAQHFQVHQGLVVVGVNHAQVISTIFNLSGKKLKDFSYEQGFVTSKKRFVDRKQALKIAWAARQVEPTQVGDELYSEDLL